MPVRTGLRLALCSRRSRRTQSRRLRYPGPAPLALRSVSLWLALCSRPGRDRDDRAASRIAVRPCHRLRLNVTAHLSSRIRYIAYNIWHRRWSRWAADASPEALWADKENANDRPFHWLIAFSDSYGALGPKACKALARDFAAYADKLPPDSEPWMVERYALFRKAFEFAADDGFVLFH